MHNKDIRPWQHSHVFGQDKKSLGERRTLIVTIITAVMMIAEILAGIIFGSMALLADGLHMASHATALSINTFAYRYARRHANDKSFNFGTGKVNTLGGFTGAILLGFFALFMAWESAKRMFAPVGIAFKQAIFVAVVGLIINIASVFILDIRKKGHHSHDDDSHEHFEHQHDDDHHHDHNLQSAYLHVLADALTSVLAIAALLSAKYFGLIWMDPLMGMIGGIMVFRWSLGLLRATSFVLLDKAGSEHIQNKIKESIETDGDSRVADLHLWSVGPGVYGAIISIVACKPLETEQYKKLIHSNLGLAHVTIEIRRCKRDAV
ncbi:MAG: CDF family Co(II)/Ni(II) efflux transporter DmeF [Candidatus Omnitrophica bacterium]|nr:CDF family Co(II)/Ni(II) efflux transporter DmeF [Candidatus Omnitrophota bacterium]